MLAAFIGKVDIEKYLAKGQIETVLADGENHEGARALCYEWVKLLYKQCKKCNVPFTFCGTGNVFIKDGKEYHICKAYQRVQALRFRLQYPAIEGEVLIQKRCASCDWRNTCNGCHWCGKCGV